jgi:hypothetical protein
MGKGQKRISSTDPDSALFSELAQARVAYLAGEGTLAAVATRYGVPLRTLERVARRERWYEQRLREHALEVLSRSELDGVNRAIATHELVLTESDRARERLKMLGATLARKAQVIAFAYEERTITDPDGNQRVARVPVASLKEIGEAMRLEEANICSLSRLADLMDGKFVDNLQRLKRVRDKLRARAGGAASADQPTEKGQG